MTTKIVIVSEFSRPSDNSTGYLVHSLIQGLNNDFSVLSVVPNKIFNSWIAQNRLSKFVKKILIMLNLIYQVRHLRDDFTSLIIVTNPFLSWFSTRLFGHFYKKYLLTFDIFPETGLEILGEKNVKILKKIRNWTLDSNIDFLCIGHDMENFLVNEYTSNCVTRLRLWVDASYKPQEKFIFDSPDLLFFGSFGELTDYGAIDLLSSSNFRGFKISIIGNGSKRMRIRLGSFPNIQVSDAVDFQNRSEVYLNKTASLVLQDPRLMGFAVPSKAFFSWQCSVPVLYFGSSKSEIFSIISEYPFLGAAFTYDKLSDSATQKLVNELLLEWSIQPYDPRISEWLEDTHVCEMNNIRNKILND